MVGSGFAEPVTHKLKNLKLDLDASLVSGMFRLLVLNPKAFQFFQSFHFFGVLVCLTL
jgi:hypothetical protein